MSYPTYSHYVPAQWTSIDRIPVDWSARRLKFTVVLRNEKVDAEAADLEYMGLEHIEPWTAQRIDDDTATSEGIATRFKKNDVLFGKLRPYLAKVYLADREGMATTEVLVLAADSCLEPVFLKYVLLSQKFIDAVSGATFGAKMPRANWEAIGGIPITLPALDEQRRIAAFLNHKISEIALLISKKQELLEKLKEKRLSVITRAVTKGADLTVEMRDSGIPWFGQLPVHWNVTPLGFLITMSGGLTPSMANTEYWDGEIPWVTPKDMKQERISESIDHITNVALSETPIALIPQNTILIVVRGMILAHSFPAAVTEGPVTINQDMKAIRCGDQVAVEYLFACLVGFAKIFSSLAQESAHGTRKLETNTLKKFPIPVPPLDEQHRIAGQLESALRKIDQLAGANRAAIVHLTEYRSALITAATTGKIDVRNIAIPDPN